MLTIEGVVERAARFFVRDTTMFYVYILENPDGSSTLARLRTQENARGSVVRVKVGDCGNH